MSKNPLKHPLSVTTIAVFLFFGLLSCIHQTPSSSEPFYILNILHINDTHSHADPEEWTVKIDGRDTKLELGGFTRMMSAIETERSQRENCLLLHGGDALQGSLYFVHYEGAVERDFLNLMKIDAMTTGNHEYDKGPSFLARFINDLRFPVLSANTQFAPESDLAGKVPPYIVKVLGGQKIGIIGLTTTETKYSSSPGGQVVFKDPLTEADHYCRDLAGRGVDKIIVLSHLGFSADRQLARTVKGIDIIVGGHSHTPLGNFSQYGIEGVTPYPWLEKGPDGRNVLIVQAWESCKVLGAIRLSFDKDGNIIGYDGAPRVIVGRPFKQRWKDTNGDGRIDGNDLYLEVTPENAPDIYQSIFNFIQQDRDARLYPEHEEAKRLHAKYARGIADLRKTVIGSALENLGGEGNDSGAGPLVADSMLLKTKAFGTVMAIENIRALRGDIPKGNITVGRIYELLPFRNTLIVIDLSAEEIRNTLEEAVDWSLKKMGYGENKYVYVSGIKFRLDPSKPRGKRISQIEVNKNGIYLPLLSGNIYKVVTNSFLAAGGDNYNTLKAASSKLDTGFIDADVFLDYVKTLKILKNTAEARVMVTETP